MSTIHRRSAAGGFTVLEVLLATLCTGVIGGCIFLLLNLGTVLFAKNVAVNMAHQEARTGLARVVRELHSSASIPQLVNIDLTPNATNGPAAGVTFQTVHNGPLNLKNDTGGANKIQIDTSNANGFIPMVGDRVIVLDYDIESDITKLTPGTNAPNHWNIWLADGSDTKIKTKKNSYIVCYITRRVGFVVKNQELRYYPNLVGSPTTYTVVARNVTSPTPFSIPLNASGTPDTRYTYVDLVVTDPTYSKRGYANTNMEIVNAHIPYRFAFTRYQ